MAATEEVMVAAQVLLYTGATDEADHPLLDSAQTVLVAAGVVVLELHPFAEAHPTSCVNFKCNVWCNGSEKSLPVVVVAIELLVDHALALSEDHAGDATARALRPRTMIDLYMVILVWCFCFFLVSGSERENARTID